VSQKRPLQHTSKVGKRPSCWRQIFSGFNTQKSFWPPWVPPTLYVHQQVGTVISAAVDRRDIKRI